MRLAKYSTHLTHQICTTTLEAGNIFLPVYREGNQGPERLSNLPKAAQLVNDEAIFEPREPAPRSALAVPPRYHQSALQETSRGTPRISVGRADAQQTLQELPCRALAPLPAPPALAGH